MGVHWAAQLSALRDFEPKLISSLRKGYGLHRLRRDFFAGITVSIVAFPLAMAVAVACGVTPDKGLFTAIIIGFFVSLLGGSRTQIGGPTAAFIVVIVGIMNTHGYEGLLAASCMAGIMLLIAGFARLGAIIQYVPYPVIAGFMSGLAVVMLTSQLKDFLGLPIEKLPIEFIARWRVYFQACLTCNMPTTLVGVGAFVGILMIRRYFPKAPVLLLVLIVTSFIVWLFDFNVETIYSKFGAIPIQLPTLEVPSLSVEDFFTLLPSAATLAFLVGIETLLSAVIADGLTGDRHRSNAELIAQGVGNIMAALCGAFPGGAGFSRTATNIKAGARTPIAGLIHVAFLCLFFVSLGSLGGMIPLTTLAAILLVTALDMMEIRRFIRLCTGPREDAFLISVTFLLTILANLTVAIQAGIIIASLFFVQRMSRLVDIKPQQAGMPLLEDGPTIAVGEALREGNIFEGELPEGVCLYHISGPFFFGSASRLKVVLDQMNQSIKVYILDLAHVPMIDATGAQVITHFVDACQRQEASVILCGLNSYSREVLADFGINTKIPRQCRVANVSTALRLAQEIIQQKTAS